MTRREDVRSLGDHALAPVGGAVVATVLWATGNMIVVGVDLPGAQLAFYRSLLGAVTFHAVLGLRGSRVGAEALRTSALGGVAYGASVIFFFSAFKATTVASATVIAALQPVLLLPYSVARLGERLDPLKGALVAVSFLGTAVVVLASAESTGDWSLGGDLLALVGTVSGCVYFVGTKKARETLGAVEYQAAALTWASGTALVGALVVDGAVETPGTRGMLAAVALVAVPGTGHLLMSWSQKHLDVSDTATIALGVTVLSSVGAAVFYDQPLGVVQVLGILVVLGALAVFVRLAAGRPPVDPAEVPVVPGE